MTINYAAVHDEKPWRKHSIHKTLEAAIDGKDGAKNLLLRVGRVANMWQTHGDVRAVFVWADGAEEGHCFRLDPEMSNTIQTSVIPIDQLLKFHSNKGCTNDEISALFTANDLLNAVASTSSSQEHLFPDELPQHETYFEGLSKQVLVNRFERSREARDACIREYGCECQVCSFDFGEIYGELGSGFIHVHHKVPVSQIDEAYMVDPIEDLIPVCPNCHAMLHLQGAVMGIDELKEFIGRSGNT